MTLRDAQTIRCKSRLRSRALWASVLAGLALAVLVPIAGKGLLLSRAQSPQENASVPVADVRSKTSTQQATSQNPESPTAERRDQAAEQSAELLKLATDLKAAVDKTTKDELSLAVIRKASEIERLAHTVREKSK